MAYNYTKVIIIGGGFGGINLAKDLKKARMEVLVLDKTNHHLFQPLLYQVAASELSPGNIAIPIREVLAKQKNATVLMAEVVDIKKAEKKVVVSTGEEYSFDYLVVATGARHSYFGNDQWEHLAPGLKTLKDAIKIRQKIFYTYELAEKSDSLDEIGKDLTFVIVGGGPTGVEIAGAIGDIAHKTLFNNFRRIKPQQSKIYLVEGMSQILPMYPEKLAKKAQKDLENMGVKVLTDSKVVKISDDGATLDNGSFIPSRNIIWAAGNQASPLLRTLDVPLDRQGRVIVNRDLSIPDYPNIFVIGDAAHFVTEEGNLLPGIAPVAIQQGRYLAKIIKNEVLPGERKPFRYWDKGTMATIGRGKAVAMVGKMQFSGFSAWMAWGIIHILYLISFSNRIVVLIRWFFLLLFNKRQERLLSQEDCELYEKEAAKKKNRK